MRVLNSLSLAVAITAATAAPAVAQQSSSSGQTASPSVIDAALVGHESEADQQRARLTDLLARDDVRDVAHQNGIDMERVKTAAAGLSDTQVSTLSSLVADATPQEGRGLGSITISVVAIIVILLILILVT